MTVIVPDEPPKIYSEADLLDCMKLVKATRWRALQKEPFFATIGMGLKVEIGDRFYGKAVDTLATDGSGLFVNPPYFLSLNHEKRLTACLHEFVHVALGHPWRRCGRIFKYYQIAADEADNILLYLSGYEIDPSWYCDVDKYKGWSVERIYADIEPKNPPPPPPPPPPGEDPPPPDGEGHGPIVVTEGGDDNVPEKKLPGEVWDGTNKDRSKMSSKDKEKRLKDLARDAASARNVERTAGNSPHAVVNRAIDAVISPETSWKSLLNTFWSDIGEKSGSTWSRFNRRAMMAGLWMPDHYRHSINHIVIGFDISSSVGREEQAVFVDQIEQLRRTTPCKLITIVPFNTMPQRDQIVELEEYDEMPKKMRTGGGTRFAPVFNWVRRMESMPDAVIMFTDLGSSNYGEPTECPILWASTVPVWDPSEDSDYTNRPPFGDVIEIEVI